MLRWIKVHSPQIAAVLFWIGMIWFIFYTLDASGQTLGEFLSSLEDYIKTAWYGPLAFLILFAVFRPFILVPTIVILVLGGRIFGLVPGFLLGSFGMTLSAIIPYYAGRIFAGEEADARPVGVMRRFARRMGKFLRKNAFEALIVMRMTHVPYDGVCFAAGYIMVPFSRYWWGTFVGNIPAAYPFVALGASFEGDLLSGDYSLNEGILASSVIVFVLAFVLAWVLRRSRLQTHDEAETAEQIISADDPTITEPDRGVPPRERPQAAS